MDLALLENKRFDYIEQIAITKSKEEEIRRLDETMNDLRAKYIRNKEQIREIEAKKIISRPLRKSHEVEKFSGMLDILKAREIEIAYEGKRYKTEKISLLNQIGDIGELYEKLDKLEEKLKANEINYINCNIGSKCLRVAEFLFSSKTCNEVFYPSVGDWREEYATALRKGRVLDAIVISVRNYFIFAYTMIICSKFGKLIEFIMKVADVVEFFNKFSK